MENQIPEGAVVRVNHRRRVAFLEEGEYLTRFEMRERFPVSERAILPNGGMTTARIELPDGRVATGEARCSVRDNYNRKIGRDIAIGRALKSL